MANDRLYLRHLKSDERLLLGTYHGGEDLLLQPASLAEVQKWMVAHLVDFGEVGRTLGLVSPFDLLVEAQLGGRYSTDPLDLVALSDARGEVERLKADNARLRGLIAKAEDAGNCGSYDPEECCPWCEGQQEWVGGDVRWATKHELDCEAFSGPGVVR